MSLKLSQKCAAAVYREGLLTYAMGFDKLVPSSQFTITKPILDEAFSFTRTELFNT